MASVHRFIPDFLRGPVNAEGPYQQMFDFRRIWRQAIVWTSLVTLLPLILITLIDYNFTQKSIESENLLRTLRIGSNAKRSTSFFLSERLSALTFITKDNSLTDLQKPQRLRDLLETLDSSFHGFVDLGLINQLGEQINYVGPYALQDKHYGDQEWFRDIQQKGFHISEMILGYRNQPHLVIAVRHLLADGSFFILRTTIDSSRFTESLQNFELTGRGDLFLINHQGIIQTPSLHHASVFTKSPYTVPKFSLETEIREETTSDGEPLLICSAYIPDSPFILMIVKHKNDLMQHWRSTRFQLIGFLVVSISIILLVILGMSTYMVNAMYLLDRRRLAAVHEIEYYNKLASIGRLAAGVAHEINNPLAIINEKAGLIKDIFAFTTTYTKDDKIIGLIDAVIASVERCGTITKRLLSFARHMDSVFEEVHLDVILEEVLGFLKKEAEYRNIHVLVKFDHHVPPFRSDRGKLQQIFLNIINNAFAAMEKGGDLVVNVEMAGGTTIRACVIDTGCGIPEADIRKIFEPFFSTKTKTGGTGLGLSITYGLVRELGGTIQVDSTVGEGTVFTVYLPTEPPPQPPDNGKDHASTAR